MGRSPKYHFGPNGGKGVIDHPPALLDFKVVDLCVRASYTRTSASRGGLLATAWECSWRSCEVAAVAGARRSCYRFREGAVPVCGTWLVDADSRVVSCRKRQCIKPELP